MVTDLAPETSENFQFNFTCHSYKFKKTGAKPPPHFMDVRKLVPTSNSFSGERQGFVCTTVKICHFSPGLFPYPQTLQALWQSFPEASPLFLLSSPVMKQCPIKRALQRSADVAAFVQCSSLFCRAAVDAQPLCHSLQPPHTVRGSLDYNGLIQQGQQNSATILYMYSFNKASIQLFFVTVFAKAN